MKDKHKTHGESRSLLKNEKMKEDEELRIRRPPGYYSNRIIRERNGGIKHQFEDDIGGCSANYK